MAGAKSCGCNWVYVGASLGWVWFRGGTQTLVAVRPDGSMLGSSFPTRTDAVLALVRDARRREGLGMVLDLRDYRPPQGGFGHGIAALLATTAAVGAIGN